MPEPSDPRTSLLGPLNGKRPPRSAWLAQMLAAEPEESRFSSGGAEIELLTWGEVGRPGLLLLHGNGAHAGWWRFIAPALADEHRVAAISWSGMGGSDWRESYSIAGFVQEIMDAVAAAKLDAGGERVQLVGHSFGGLPLVEATCRHPGAFASGVLIDTFLPRVGANARRWASSGQAKPVYPTEAEALARFRFAPLQDTPNLDIVDFIARGSLREVDGGWTWRFDPNLWANLDPSSTLAAFETVPVPIALLYGETSALVDAAVVERMRSLLPCCPMVAAIPGAAHHVMVDQPIALIAALRLALGSLPNFVLDRSRDRRFLGT